MISFSLKLLLNILLTGTGNLNGFLQYIWVLCVEQFVFDKEVGSLLTY